MHPWVLSSLSTVASRRRPAPGLPPTTVAGTSARPSAPPGRHRARLAFALPARLRAASPRRPGPRCHPASARRPAPSGRAAPPVEPDQLSLGPHRTPADARSIRRIGDPRWPRGYLLHPHDPSQLPRSLLRTCRASFLCSASSAMSVASGPALLGVALAVSWISSTAAYTLPSSEQAGISQKSIGCMPCSRQYVGDAYLDILSGQLDHHRRLVEMSYAGDMCSGLADDVDVPKLSELHRELVGEGSHRRLVYSMQFAGCQDAMVSFLDSYDAHLVVIEKLPNGVFADPFELQHFVERKVFLNVAVFGDSNLELPSALSNRSAVEVHVDLRPSISVNCRLIIDLPLHARYPPLDAIGYATVEFGSPDLLIRYHKKKMHSDSCLWALKNLNDATVEKAAWRIPCGDEAHIGLVSSITFLAALVSSVSIVLAALIF